MKKQDWKNLTIFLIFLLTIAPLVYLAALRLFSYEGDPPKARRFLNIRQGETILIGEFEPCPVIPTSLCEKKAPVILMTSAKEPTRL